LALRVFNSWARPFEVRVAARGPVFGYEEATRHCRIFSPDKPARGAVTLASDKGEMGASRNIDAVNMANDVASHGYRVREDRRAAS